MFNTITYKLLNIAEPTKYEIQLVCYPTCFSGNDAGSHDLS